MTKVVLITGGSGTIGAAIAKAFAPDYSIVIGYNTNKAKAEAVQNEIIAADGEAAVFCADVSEQNQAEALFAFALERYGHVDVLINSAGISLCRLATETTEHEWQRVFDVNAKGVFNMCRAVLPGMINRKSGAIINISSMWGITGASCETAYSASKAAVIGYTKALAKEIAPSGITVNAIAPGFIDGDMNAALSENDRLSFIEDTPLGRAGTPGDVAHAAMFFAQNTFTTGQVLSVDGGIVI